MREGGKCWCVGTPVDRLSVVIPAKLWLSLSYTCDSPLQCVLCSAECSTARCVCRLCVCVCVYFWLLVSIQSLILVPVCVCLGACFDPVSHPGAWAILQWAPAMNDLANTAVGQQASLEYNANIQAGHHSLGDVGATPATVSCVQRGEEIWAFFLSSPPPPLPRPSLSPLYLFSFSKPLNVVVCWNWRIYTLWIK